MEIINNYIEESYNKKLLQDMTYKAKRYETNRKYYLKNKIDLDKKHTEYSKTYAYFNPKCNLFTRLNYYKKKGLFEDMKRSEAIEVTNYLINNNLTIKYIEYVTFFLELSKIKMI